MHKIWVCIIAGVAIAATPTAKACNDFGNSTGKHFACVQMVEDTE